MSDSCPLNSGSDKTSSVSDAYTPPSRISSSEGIDETMIFKTYFGIRHFVGLGLLSAALLPRKVSLGLAAICLVPSAVKLVVQATGLFGETKEMSHVMKQQRMCPQIEGDFVVFLIGSKPNGLIKVNSTYKWMGEAFQSMVDELEADPESGYLGGETYSTFNTMRTGGMMVQYWRSYEHLHRYARAANKKHRPIWSQMFKIGKGNSNYGVWHETYKVRAGEFEGIYVNMPRFGLGHAGTVVPAKGNYKSSASRMNAQKCPVDNKANQEDVDFPGELNQELY